MKLIDESKIADGSNEAYLKLKHNAYFGNGFQSGVYFAENEIQNLSIEFADWLAIYYDYGHSEEYWFGHDGKYTSSELFKKFIDQRTK